MSISKALKENPAVIDRLGISTLSERDAALVDSMAAVGDLFEEIGRTDAVKGRYMRSEAHFSLWGEHIGNHLQGRYEEGYKAGQGVSNE